MKASDYEAIVQKISDPDTLAEGIVELNEKLKIDELEFNKNTESIANLRDINSKLALRITEPVKVEPEQVEPEETYDDFLTKLRESLKEE